MYHLFFFFKQKTAYEMRISDWSSDVCSSDLAALRRGHRADRIRHRPAGKRRTVGWVGSINPATKETDNRTPERWVDGANPAYVDGYQRRHRCDMIHSGNHETGAEHATHAPGRRRAGGGVRHCDGGIEAAGDVRRLAARGRDRKSTRMNSMP